MRRMVSVLAMGLLLVTGWASAECPSADLTGDCFVDLADMAVLAEQWMTGRRDPLPQELAALAGGAFAMGDAFGEGASAERPVHVAAVSAFHMGKYEVTNGQYCAFLNDALGEGLVAMIDGVAYQGGSGTVYPYCNTAPAGGNSLIVHDEGAFSVADKGGRDVTNDPIVGVSWYGAAAYCNWRSAKEGFPQCYDLATWACDFSKKGYRLPTEAEWEYAARAGLGAKRFPWGDTISHTQANYNSTAAQAYDVSPTAGYHPAWNDGIMPYTSPVGAFTANAFGLYDMAGNVWEWCNDWYAAGYYSGRPDPDTDPTGPATGTARVLRGGGWAADAAASRVARRNSYAPDGRIASYGFRVVLAVD